MYAFAPVSLYALRQRDPDRVRPYRLPAYRILSPAGFVSANLIIYWSSLEALGSLVPAVLVGLVDLRDHPPDPRGRRSAGRWTPVGRVGLAVAGRVVVIGYFGRYGGNNALPNWWDLVCRRGVLRGDLRAGREAGAEQRRGRRAHRPGAGRTSSRSCHV